MPGPLDTDAILQGMADAIPTHPAGDQGSDLSSSYEVLALLIHAYMAALKFRLLGFDEDKRTGTSLPTHGLTTTRPFQVPTNTAQRTNAPPSLPASRPPGTPPSVPTASSTRTSSRP